MDTRRVTLRLMEPEEFSQFIAMNLHDYAADLVRVSGMTSEAAAAKASRDTEAVRKQGPNGPEHRVFAITVPHEGGATIGGLWIGTFDQWRSAWLFDLRVVPERRGQGYGRAALDAAEQAASDMGATALKLHAFGDNQTALALYRSAGFSETDITMRKPIGG